MFTALLRIIKYGFLGFWRNGWLSTATISILVVALIVFEGLIIFRVLTNTALDALQDKIDISIYFKISTPEDEVLRVQKSISAMAEVKSVDYISRDRALEIFKARHEDDEAISQSLEELEENPLLASLNIKANDPEEYEAIATYLDNASFRDSFEKVTYAQNAIVIDRLNRIIDTAEKGAFALIVFLAFVAILVTFNTIRLAIYSNREEIGIMRLVGASNPFIRGPYIVEGMIYGIIAAILSVVIVAPVIYFASPYVGVFIPEMNLWNHFVSNLLKLTGYQIFFGTALGVISSVVAIRKYLRI